MGPGTIKDEDSERTPPEAIIAEAQRRIEERAQQQGSRAQDTKTQTITDKLNQGVYWLARHWLAIFNIVAGLYVGVAILPPILFRMGMPRLANIIYAIYAPFCHQYPFRSWFLFGERLVYPLTEPISVIKMNKLSEFVGNAEVGYKMALCQRDIATHGALFFGGLAYGVLRSRRKIVALPFWTFVAFGMGPMLLDGGTQWLSYFLWVLVPQFIQHPFETIPLMRALTGALFGLMIIAVGYPRLNTHFDEARQAIA